MGATGWSCTVPWRGDFETALREARAEAYALVPLSARQRAEAMEIATLLRAMDLDLDDEDLIEAFSAWLRAAPPETRFVVSRGPDATGTVMDADHLERERPSASLPSASLPSAPSLHANPGGMLHLQAPVPGLLGVRIPRSEELEAWFETAHPTLEQLKELDLERGEVIAVQLEREGRVAFVGVSGD